MRDTGILHLGPHYAAFNDTFSRDSYRWNVAKVRKTLAKLAAIWTNWEQHPRNSGVF